MFLTQLTTFSNVNEDVFGAVEDVFDAVKDVLYIPGSVFLLLKSLFS